MKLKLSNLCCASSQTIGRKIEELNLKQINDIDIPKQKLKNNKYYMYIKNVKFNNVYVYSYKISEKSKSKSLRLLSNRIKLAELKGIEVHINEIIVILNIDKNRFASSNNSHIIACLRINKDGYGVALKINEEIKDFLGVVYCDICFNKICDIKNNKNNLKNKFSCDCKNKLLCNDCLEMLDKCPWCRKNKI